MDGESVKTKRVVMWPGVLLTVMLALFAFCSSFDALRVVFLASNMDPAIAWMGPLCVDGIVGLCTMAVWWFRKLGVRATWYPWAGFVLFGCLSIVGNMLHARPVAVQGVNLPGWAPALLASIPPTAFMYATHLLVIVATRRLETSVEPSPDAAPAVSDADLGVRGDALGLESVADVEPGDGSGKGREPIPAPVVARDDPNAADETVEGPVLSPFVAESRALPLWTPPEPSMPPARPAAVEETTPRAADEAGGDEARPTPPWNADAAATVAEPVVPTSEPTPAERTDRPREAAEPAAIPSSAPVARASGTPRIPGGHPLEEWVAWLRRMRAEGIRHPISADAVAADLASSKSTAKKALRMVRELAPEEFES